MLSRELWRRILGAGGVVFAVATIAYVFSADRAYETRRAEASREARLIHDAEYSSVPNAAALLYVPGPFRRHYEVAAEMRLPRLTRNRSWYAVWLMLVEYGQGDQPFIQAGLMRRRAHDFRLTAFITARATGERLSYADVGELRDGAHRIALRGDARLVEFVLDGRVAHRFNRARLLRGARRIYMQVGGGVHAPGDSLVAAVGSLHVKHDGDAVLHSEPILCARHDRGLAFRKDGSAYTITGLFDQHKQSRFIGCWNFTSAHRRIQKSERPKDTQGLSASPTALMRGPGLSRTL